MLVAYQAMLSVALSSDGQHCKVCDWSALSKVGTCTDMIIYVVRMKNSVAGYMVSGQCL